MKGRSRELVLAISVVGLMAGCTRTMEEPRPPPGPTGGPPATPAIDGGSAPAPDASAPAPFALDHCTLQVVTPVPGSSTAGLVTIEVIAQHESAAIARAAASIQRCGAAEVEPLGEQVVSDGATEVSFTWTWDGSGAEAGDYCVVVAAAVALPSDAPEGAKEPFCEAQASVLLDNECPTVTVGAQAGPVIGTLPVTVTAEDASPPLELVVLGPDGELMATLQPDGEGVYSVDVDVCDLETGAGGLTVEAVDALQNRCATPLAAQWVACPRFETATVLSAAPYAAPRHAAIADLDGDGDDDLLVATAAGVQVHDNDGQGGLGPARALPGVDAAARFVIADDMNDDGQTDLIVVEPHLGETWVRTYLWADVVVADPGYDPSALPEDQRPAVWPTIQVPAFAPVETWVIEAPPTAVWYGHLDPLEPDFARDLIVGTASDSSAVVVLRGASPGACAYHAPQLDENGQPIPTSVDVGCLLEPLPTSGVGNVSAIAVADMVEDDANLRDVVVAYADSKLLTVFQHVGQGDLLAGQGVTLPAAVGAIAAGYFDLEEGAGAGAALHRDLLVSFPDRGELWALYGVGDGSFAVQPGGLELERRAYCVEGRPTDFALFPNTAPGAIGLGMAVVNESTETLWVQHDEGLGEDGIVFGAARVFDTLGDPEQVLPADLDGDGHVDFVVRGASGVAVLADADGAPRLLRAAPDVTTPIPPQAAGAIDGCGHSKQAANGAASLGDPGDRLKPRRMVTGDLTGDGKPELVVVPERTPALLPSGPGPLQLAVLTYADGPAGLDLLDIWSHEPPDAAVAVEVAQTDLGGTLDLLLATATYGEDSVQVLESGPPGSFAAGPLIGAGELPVAMARLQCAGSFLDDLATLATTSAGADCATQNILRVFRGHPSGPTLAGEAQLLCGESGTQLATAPLLTGGPDALVLTTTTGVHLYAVSSPLCALEPLGGLVIGQGVQAAAAGDLNGDGATDIVAPLASGALAILWGLDGQDFAAPDVALQLSGTLTAALVADVNGDALPDVLLLDTAGDRLRLLMNAGGGALLEAPHRRLGPGTTRLALEDLDLNGCPDVLALSPARKAVSVLTNLRVGCAE